MKYLSPIAVSLALAIIGCSAQAQEFKHQASIGFGYTDLNGSSSDMFSVNYSYHLDKVSTDSPFALNTFLAQSSQLDVAYMTSGSNSNSAFIGGTWVSDSNWFVRGGYNASLDHFGDMGTANMSLGYYLSTTTEIAFNYSRSDVDNGSSWNESNYEVVRWGAHARSWFELPTTQGIDAGFEYERFEYDHQYNGNRSSSEYDSLSTYADWYLTKSLSVGLNAAYLNPDQGNSDSAYIASVDYWLPLGNTFSLQSGANVNLNSDNDVWSLYVALTSRF
ncbi:hypothetical protein L2725_15995 [Shewanella corallii]|uniref:Uncharacterized protein n=1 Tax=Shewanella corallii TaxID=560080 RepID=A0ABT0N9Y2_9GAMM|nr:hypothetical protein [Shewanella corallii]MCL2915263.1 hypothetical protein [Shewanella corallii]